ncbi:hypothetical protein [Caballeronia sp. KNU42]
MIDSKLSVDSGLQQNEGVPEGAHASKQSERAEDRFSVKAVTGD